MASSASGSAAPDRAELVRRAFSAALRGDIDGVSQLLAEDVHWYGAGGDPSAGCTNRREAVGWIRQTITRGIGAEVLDVRAVDPDRVLVRLRREPSGGEEPAEAHAQIITFRGDQVAEIVVYPSEDEALAAIRSR